MSEQRPEPESAPVPAEATASVSAGEGAAPASDTAPTIISKALRPTQPSDTSLSVLVRGRRLAHFELEEPIGVGGMAAVIRARDTNLDRLVALKVLPPEMAAESDNVRRFEQEARAAAKLDHENIARVFYCGEDQGLHFIAFEFVEGQNLRDMIERRGYIPAPEAVHYTLQIASALAHAAARAVVHRDIKPSNIIVGETGRAKLVDMGLARSLETASDKGLTQSGVTLGTFDYISPEQALEPREADIRSDIYSLGCTLYHMLTGQPPVPEGTAARKLQFHQQVAPLDPRQLNPDIPDEVAAILGKMMAKDPSERYQGPELLVQHLFAAAQKLSGEKGTVPKDVLFLESVLPSPPRVRPLTALVFAAVAVALLVSMVSIFVPSEPEAVGDVVKATPRRAAERDLKPRIVPVAPVIQDDADSMEPWEVPESLTPAQTERSVTPEKPAATAATPEPTGRPGQPSSPPERPVAKPKPERITQPPAAGELIVDGQTHRSVDSALAAADSDEVTITIKINGRLSDMPLNIRKKKKVTIRAAEGYRPVLVLDPRYVPGTDGEAALFRVHDEELVLEGLEFRLPPLREKSTKFQSVVAVTGAGRVDLSRCVATLEGGEVLRMAFIALGDPTGSMMGNDGKPPRINIPPSLRIADSFARGEGDFVAVRASRPFDLDVRNSLVALDGSFLNVDGNKPGATAESGMTMTLQRVTAYFSQHLVRMWANAANPSLVQLDVTSAASCIFISTENKPLLYVEGQDKLNRLLSWRGERNVYSFGPDGSMLEWRPLSPPNMIMSELGERYKEERWKDLWNEAENQPRFQSLKLAGFSSPQEPRLVQVLPEDFRIMPPSDAPDDLDDLRSQGADLDRLPRPSREVAGN